MQAVPAAADVPVALEAGYAFRPSAGQLGADDRFHGAAGGLRIDAPPVLHGFSGRLALQALAWPAGTRTTDPVLSILAVPSLTYRFDDSGPQATAAVGPVIGWFIDGEDDGVIAGVEASLTLRLPLIEGIAVDGRVGMGTLSRLGFYGTGTIGISFEPDVLIGRALAGDGPEAVAREVAPTMFPHDEGAAAAHDDEHDDERGNGR
ncbi:MAG TPA: hypothetical protein VGF99_14505 [Myxococcota bacterium]